MRTTIVLIGMTLNLILLAGIIYLNYFAPRPMQYARQAQHEKKKADIVRKIALICPDDAVDIQQIIEGFTETLDRDAQFTPEVKVYNANANRTLMRSNIEAAIESQYDVLVPITSQAAQMTKELTEKRKALTPIVFAGTGDPVKLELIEDPDASGNHLTGVSIVGLDWIDQMVDLIPVLAPHVKRILIPYDPTGLGGALEQYKQRFDAALERHDYEVECVQIFAANEISQKVPSFVPNTDMIILLPDSTMIEGIDTITKLCKQHEKCCFVAQNLAMLGKGATFAFGYHVKDIGVGAAQFVRRIIENDEHPSQIPLNRMESTFRIGVNVDNARDQGVLKKLDECILFLMENGEVIEPPL